MNLSEHTLIELKAKVSNLKPVRRRLNELKAKHVGTFKQTDTYLGVPKGRLKLRKINSEKTQLIYYERDSLPKPKRSDVFVMEIPESKAFPALLKRVLKTRATVKKIREIYWHQGTQIHLDTVDGIGCYVKFERKTPNTQGQIENNTNLLEELMETLGIKTGPPEKMSYGALANLE